MTLEMALIKVVQWINQEKTEREVRRMKRERRERRERKDEENEDNEKKKRKRVTIERYILRGTDLANRLWCGTRLSLDML